IDWSNTKSVSDYGITLSSPADYTTCSISPDNGNGWDKCYAYVTIDNKFQDINNFDFSTKWDKPDMVRDIKYSYTTTSQTTTVPETVILNETTNKTIDKSMNTFGAFSVNKLPINYGTTSAIRIDFEKRRWQEVAFNATISVIPKNMGIDNIINIELDPDVSACGNLDTANSVYTLTANVSSANYCFHIIANNITLDGAGYWVNYSQSAAGYGVNNSGGYDNITVKNLNIVQENALVTGTTNHAIYSSGMANSTITNNTISVKDDLAYGIHLESSSTNTITNNTISASGSSGYGIYLYLSSNSNTLSNNTITTSGSYGYGISLVSSSTNTFLNNIVTKSGSDGYGIHLASSSTNTITNNTISASGSSSDGIHLYSSSTNTISSNIVTGVNCRDGIHLESSSNSNILSNNTVTTSGSSSSGIYLYTTGTNNNITGGSIISGNIDYYLRNAGETNNFTNTNFTATRQIYFYDVTSYFNYNNETGGNIWLKTNVSAAGSINRTLSSWNNTLMKWNDTNSTAGITANYNLTGLFAGKSYSIYNTSAGAQTMYYNLMTDAGGNLPGFAIALNGNTEIKVNKDSDLPQWSANATSKTSPQTYAAANNYGFQINWSASAGFANATFQLGRPNGGLANYTISSTPATSGIGNSWTPAGESQALWQYRKPIVINGSTSQVNDYQIMINLTNRTAASDNFNFAR
ncbi:right-handed parallel beta-helix repeat-containing protein, partial [Patescibacteria group bacterium]|nr:right-handed parallel beta-helix repeat-containing protein [Patescibacteria group bacterium]